MEARAGEAKGRRPGSFEAQRAAKIAANAEVQRAGKVSGQEIHLRGASSEKSFKVIPRSVWSQDESLDKIAQNYKKRGMNVVFIYGNIGLEGGGYARGAHRGNVMYINIADGDATAEQIAAHEYFHDFLDRYAQTGSKAFKKSANEVRSWAVQQLVEKIRRDYNDGIDELMNVYAETYFTDEDGNITVSADYILEEILCDAAADIDILAGRKAETQRAPLYGETVREELNRMDEAITRADTDDGGEKYSRGKYWYPDLTQEERSLLEETIERELPQEDKYIDEYTKWAFVQTAENSVFALYGVGDGTEATILYASGGSEAKTDYAQTIMTMEGINEAKTNRASINKLFEAIRNESREHSIVTTLAQDRSANDDDVRIPFTERRRDGRTNNSKSNGDSGGEHYSRVTDEEKANAFLQTYGYLASVEDGIRFVGDNISQKAEEVNTDFSRVTPQQDADYLAAVERGDVETAQKMVDEAAKAALSDSEARNDDDKLVKLYHATDAVFTVFDLNKLGANTDGGEKFSIATLPNTDGDNKGLNRNTIQALQGITQKSINSLTSAELQNAAPVAKRYWQQLGIKSPFFRAWFGDWRANDTTPIEIADKAGSTREPHHNNDTGWEIRVSRQVFNETMAHNAEKNTSARPYLPYIDDIIKKAVLLDSFTMGGHTKSENSLLMHSFYAFADVGNGRGVRSWKRATGKTSYS